MTPKQQRLWDEWAKGHVDRLREEIELAVEDISAVTGTLERCLNSEVERLYSAMADVRREIMTLRVAQAETRAAMANMRARYTRAALNAEVGESSSDWAN